jgi:DNA-directed RNA polymerase specialized sigma24 family protein
MQLYSNTGDGSPLESLILSCVEPVERMAYTYCGDLSNHEDFVSVGMLRVCEVAAHAQAHAIEPCTYLCKAAQYAMIDEYNRLYRPSVLSLDAPLSKDSLLCLHDLVPDGSSVPAPTFSKRVRVLHGALMRLSARQRAAVRRLAGLPGYGVHTREETARVVRCSPHAAHCLDYHGRRNLRSDVRLCKVLGVEVAQ